MSVQRGALVIGVILLVFVFARCGGSEEEEEAPVGEEEGPSVPSTPEEANNVLVRVSGTQGTTYIGSYSTLRGELQIVEDTTLGDEPQEYEVPVEEGEPPDGVTASFQKRTAGTVELKAEIVADEVVVAESMTLVPTGSVIVEWIPEEGFQVEEEVNSDRRSRVGGLPLPG
jgi:hypothetical protein